MPESINNFENNIFINCPYDPGYRQMLRVLIFTVIKCGFEPQIAMEQVNSWDVRINKIKDLIKCSKLSIHDISRMGSPNGENLPRFNLPFELGMDLGCRTYGRGRLKDKKCLILEEKSDRYFKAISDISGNDIKAHQSEPQKLNKVVRSWIRAITGKRTIPGPRKIWENFIVFYTDFIDACKLNGLSDEDIEEMPITEYIDYVKEWFNISVKTP